MNIAEKKLLFRFCGLTLWILKEILLSSEIEDDKKKRIVDEKLEPLIRSVTNKVNEL